MASDSPLMLEDVTTDLGRVLAVVDELRQQQGAASYDDVQRQTADELGLHLLSYVRFLEGQSLLAYDRISDEMELTDQGLAARENPDSMTAAAQSAFADQISDDVGGDEDFADMFDDMAHEMDAALGGGAQEPAAPQDNISPSGGVSGGNDLAMEAPQSSMNDPINTSEDPASSGVFGQGENMNQQTYERIEEIGSGGIGTVYRGRQTRLNREVALKEIREIFNVFAGVQRDDIIERFQSIIETQASLVHPNIVQIIDIDTSGEFPFSVMQLAPGGNLRRLIEHGERPPLKVAIKYFLQILHALNIAHDQGVVHGSLKPENVVLDHAGNALVTDFGVSRIVERDGGRGNQVYVGVGTVAYMSPEQFQDPNLATVKSDIYSLGIMFYEMLTGKVPGRRSPMPSSFYPDIPRALDDVFDRMSMDREEDRYNAVEDIIADIYAAEQVLEILDKRSGVLFLRDPMAHGELGLGEGAAASIAATAQSPAGGNRESGGDGESAADADASPQALAEPSAADMADEGLSQASESQEASAADQMAPEDGQIDDHEANAAGEFAERDSGDSGGDHFDDEAVVETEAEGDDDVLGKLDKYGDMFDDED